MQESKFNKILNEINFNIFNGGLTDIIEVTYAYTEVANQQYWNDTLFGYFGGFRYDLVLDLKLVESITKKKLNKKISDINKYIAKLNDAEIIIDKNKIKKNILLGSLKYANNCLKMAYIGVPFELEKVGYKHNLKKSEILNAISELEVLEKQNFGGRISDNIEESKLVYDYVFNTYKNNKKNLTKKEKLEYKEYIKKIKSYISEDYITSITSVHKKIKTDKKLEKRLSKKISRKKYTKIFETILNDFLGLNFRVIHEERSSIYDGPGYLSIPKDDNYAYLSVKKVIQLIGHEIEVHCFNYRINEALLGSFRGAGNLEKEEGLAMIMEDFLNGKQLENITITNHFVKVFATEIFILSDLKRFLFLYGKLLKTTEIPFTRILRQKRNYPLTYKGGQHKDTTYGRGIQKVLKFLQDGGDMRELYLGKVAIDDIPNIKRLLEINGSEIGDLNIPIFLGELILFLFKNNKKESSCDDFINYLKNKYYFIDFQYLDLLIVKEFVRIKATIGSKLFS